MDPHDEILFLDEDFWVEKNNKQKTRQPLNLKQLPDIFFFKQGFLHNFGELYGKKT